MNSDRRHITIEESGFDAIWPQIDRVRGFLVPGQERFLYETVRSLPEDAVIVEVGAFMGRSTTAMAFACRGTCRRIFSIDTFKGNSIDFVSGKQGVEWNNPSFRREFESNLQENDLLQYVVPLVGYSNQIGQFWSKPIDFIFIDGSHIFEDVVTDFENFFPWVKPGGIMAFHDVTPNWSGPYNAWEKVIKPKLVERNAVSTLAYGRKPAVPANWKIHAIVPVHNRKDGTRRLLDSLLKQTISARIDLIVVDDGSADGTAEMLRVDYPMVTVIKGDGELWWTGAVAKAIDEQKHAFGENDFILLCNNDSILCSGTVETLADVSFRGGRVSVAARAIDQKGRDVPAGGNIKWLPDRIGQGVVGSAAFHPAQNVARVDAIFGRCSLFPVEVVLSASSFDAATFPQYWGDTDFCLRAASLGHRFYITQETTVLATEDEGTTGLHYVEDRVSLRKAWASLVSVNSNNCLLYLHRFIDRHASPEKRRQYRLRYTMRAFVNAFSKANGVAIVFSMLALPEYAGEVFKLAFKNPRRFMRRLASKLGVSL